MAAFGRSAMHIPSSSPAQRRSAANPERRNAGISKGSTRSGFVPHTAEENSIGKEATDRLKQPQSISAAHVASQIINTDRCTQGHFLPAVEVPQRTTGGFVNEVSHRPRPHALLLILHRQDYMASRQSPLSDSCSRRVGNRQRGQPPNFRVYCLSVPHTLLLREHLLSQSNAFM